VCLYLLVQPADDLDWPTARNEAAAQNGKKVGFCLHADWVPEFTLNCKSNTSDLSDDASAARCAHLHVRAAIPLQLPQQSAQRQVPPELWKTLTPDVQVGVVGFCQGGSLTLIAAQQSRAASAAPFYGVPKVGTGCRIIWTSCSDIAAGACQAGPKSKFSSWAPPLPAQASAEAVGFEAEKIKIPVRADYSMMVFSSGRWILSVLKEPHALQSHPTLRLSQAHRCWCSLAGKTHSSRPMRHKPCTTKSRCMRAICNICKIVDAPPDSAAWNHEHAVIAFVSPADKVHAKRCAPSLRLH